MRRFYPYSTALVFLVMTFQTLIADTSTPVYRTANIADIQQARQHQVAATVISANVTHLSSEITAKIDQFHIRPGAFVKQDQLLVSLDCRDAEDHLDLLQARLAEAQANLNQAQRLAKRLSSLRERRLTDDLSVEDAISEVSRQQARVSAVSTEIQLAQRDTSRCSITAPFEAAITEQFAGEGELASPGSLLLELQQVSDAEIEATLPVNRFDFTTDLSVEFRTREELYPLQLLRVSPVIDNTHRSQKVWFAAPEELPVGSSGELILTESQSFLPAEYIVMRSGKLGVFIIDEGEPVFMPLANAQEGRPYPVSKDWSSMDIVTEGHQWLQSESTK